VVRRQRASRWHDSREDKQDKAWNSCSQDWFKNSVQETKLGAGVPFVSLERSKRSRKRKLGANLREKIGASHFRDSIANGLKQSLERVCVILEHNQAVLRRESLEWSYLISIIEASGRR
jgi:hypothetical protein